MNHSNQQQEDADPMNDSESHERDDLHDGLTGEQANENNVISPSHTVEENDDEEPELSLDDLGAAYARVAAEHDPESFSVPEQESAEEEVLGEEYVDAVDVGGVEQDDQAATPEAIIEGALFVGHPDNKPLSEQRIASLMRDVTPQEVEEMIEQLNASYTAADQALRIVRDERGYRMTIAPEVEDIRRSFLGKVREARLSQPAIDVLALVAYQPGITSQVVQDQRGQDSGAILNQLVRRQLIKLERRAPKSGGKKVPHYYITERFLQLFGLESIEDLPQVEESFRD